MSAETCGNLPLKNHTTHAACVLLVNICFSSIFFFLSFFCSFGCFPKQAPSPSAQEERERATAFNARCQASGSLGERSKYFLRPIFPQWNLASFFFRFGVCAGGGGFRDACDECQTTACLSACFLACWMEQVRLDLRSIRMISCFPQVRIEAAAVNHYTRILPSSAEGIGEGDRAWR